MTLDIRSRNWKEATLADYEVWLEGCFRIFTSVTSNNLCYLLQRAAEDNYHVVNELDIVSTLDIGYSSPVVRIAKISNLLTLRDAFFDPSFNSDNNGILFNTLDTYCPDRDDILIYDVMQRIQVYTEPIELESHLVNISYFGAFFNDGKNFITYSKSGNG